jgi:hypothetical protein
MPLEAAHNGGAYAGGTAHISGDLCVERYECIRAPRFVQSFDSRRRCVATFFYATASSHRQICARCLAACDSGEDMPGAGYTFELMLPAWLEVETRSGGEVDDGSGHEDLVGTGERRNAIGDVDCNAC